jgi:hypothetical protein
LESQYALATALNVAVVIDAVQANIDATVPPPLPEPVEM